MLNVLSFFFIIQVLDAMWWMLGMGFDAQRFELFLYSQMKKLLSLCLILFRCSMFWAFSLYLYRKILEDDSFWVSMLNVLSFFFIRRKKFFPCWTDKVSMLNVLSFFFIAHSTTAMNKHLLRGISEETSPCALFIHFYHYTTINKAVENCSEKILKLKIISPPLLYKYL